MEEVNTTTGQRLLGAWAILTLVMTFFLLCTGGIVTSKGVGMAVPDWPTTYGYNMFLFPVSKWVGGIFYEHSHRLVASGVGLMTMILAAGILAIERRRWVRWLGVGAFVMVCLQGLLGGLRVTLYKDEIGIFHALLAQAFFCVVGVLVIATSARFRRGEWDFFSPDRLLRNVVVGTTGLVFLQLGLGATMRHEHAGLAIPDFPRAYGQWIPDTSPAAIAVINEGRVARNEVPTNALYIWVQMVHRGVAVAILVGALAAFWRARSTSRLRVTKSWSLWWLGMIVAQGGLGAWTIWSNKAADVATTHMALGALILLVGVAFSFRLIRGAEAARFRVSEPSIPGKLASTIA